MPVAVRLAAHTTDELCSLIEKGMSRAKIAELWGCTRGTIQLWIEGDAVRRERERVARQAAGDDAVDKAEAVLKAIPDQGSVAQVARARELAQHYRWLASKLSPAYAEKMTHVHEQAEIDPNSLTDAQLAAISARGRVIDGSAEDVTGPKGQEAAPAMKDKHTRGKQLGGT
jgi:hypothetical protein